MNENENYFSKIYWRLILFSFHSALVSEMTYTVLSGTLNSSIPYHTISFHKKFNHLLRVLS